MNQEQLAALLTSFTGQLQTIDAHEEKNLEQLQQSIAASIVSQDPTTIRRQEFLFERSDLVASHRIPVNRLKTIADVTKLVSEQGGAPDTHVFVRNLPVRTTQIAGSITPESAGARVNTAGPFTDINGVIHWFDFVNVKKLVSLFVQGQAMPVILFDATFREPRFHLINGKPVELTRNFIVIPESVWIQTKLFDPVAPPDRYCGLRVKSGTIILDTDPFMDANRLTISTGCNVVCDLQLDQNNSFASDPSSPYGVDARNAKFDLPQTFKFSFHNNIKNISSVGDAAWKVYGQDSNFTYTGDQNCIFNPFLNRLAIHVDCSNTTFSVPDCQSPFFQLSSDAKIMNSWWTIPVAIIDIARPLEADGNGGLILECAEGLEAQWNNLKNKNISLPHPFIIGEPGRIGITDLASDGLGAFQEFEGWQDEQNLFGTSMECRCKKAAMLIFNTVAQGDEMVFTLADLDVKTDRPVKVNGEAVSVKTKDSVFILAVSKFKNLLLAIDENILWDNKLPSDKIPHVKPYALAMHNALFTVTPPNSLVLFAECSNDLKTLIKGKMYLGFGLFSYLPTLPDPYAANLGILEAQFSTRGNDFTGAKFQQNQRRSVVWMWLIGLVQWEKRTPPPDKVGVSFHFAPLQAPLQIQKETEDTPNSNEGILSSEPQNLFQTFTANNNVVEILNTSTGAANFFNNESSKSVSRNPLALLALTDFALLDVSSKANQMGVSFSKVNNQLQRSVARKFEVNITDENNATVFPIQVTGLDVVTAGMNVQAFAMPAIAWEPVFNLTKPTPLKKDPPIGFNYYQNDGIATRIGNLSRKPVALSPIPMAKYLVETYKDKEDGKTFAIFNLPFGMLAITILDNKSSQAQKPKVGKTSPVFENYINGGIQLELTAGTSFNANDSDTIFEGYTIQLLNINRADGTTANASTLGGDVWTMYNDEFLVNQSNQAGRPAVPVKNIGLSGYGTSMFSEWQNKNVLVGTSQAYFNVITGRTSHEVVQVKSKLYCCGADVVRTITIFRLANGYVARIDSGWESRSDGKYNFIEPPATVNKFNFHPGIVRGYFNIRNIKELPQAQVVVGAATFSAVTFDADIELENVTEGGQNNRASSKSILGYVQLLPLGKYIDAADFVSLLKYENNSIGGSIGCVIKIAGTNQRMKLNRADVSAAVDKSGNPIFVCSARGSVIMPKDGSWAMIQHERKTGDVTPLPEQLSVPLIREGSWDKDHVVNPSDISNFIRIAHPEDLLKLPDDSTINFGFLQNMGTQKVLFMTPGFKQGIESLLSKTPPLLADAYRLMNTKGIFPNIGNIENNFGQAISLLKGIDGTGNPLDAFNKINVPDAGQVFDVLQLKAKEEAGKLLDQGYKLAKGAINGIANDALKFDLPSFDYPLINLDGKLIINIQYKAESKPKGQPPKNYVGKFDFDVDSFAGDLADTWKGRMNNLVMVVTIGPLTDVMKIKGNFNSQKGKDVDLGSKNASDNPALNLPTPEIEFSDALEPVIKILEILASLSTGDYAGALNKGLKVAMSNSANIWEYKFEASKDIPLVRFPPTDELYNSPTTPLKLEASLGIGVSFNAALKVTTDPKQLLPTAGGFFKFHGGLQVMCVSVGVGTIYAVGQVDLKLEADTSPKVGVTLKFGFGAQITVGLPVVGHVSVLFMIGVEIYADSGSVVKITGFMLFRGEAELLGGLVSVTITIEAKGSIEKAGPGTPTTCMAQVTFAIDISIFLVINIDFSQSWQESRQIA